MTRSRHEYTAVVIGTPDVALSLVGGSLTLDAGNAPHVTGSLEIVTPDTTTLDALDPRENPRIRVDVTATFPTSTQTRSFNLGLRSRPVRQADGTTTLAVSSDEALLLDYKTLADDDTPFDYQTSLRAVINYVLGTVIPGKALAGTPSNNADVSALFDVTNLIQNPSAETNLTGWVLGTNSGTLERVNAAGYASQGSWSVGFRSVATGDSWLDYTGQIPVSAGEQYTFSIDARRHDSDANVNVALMIRFIAADGTRITDTLSTPVSVTNAFSRLTHTATAPPNASRVTLHVRQTTGGASRRLYVDGALLHEGVYPVTYFDGAKTDTASYLYDWQDTAHASTSTRRAYPIERDPESLVWRAGQSAFDFLQPLFQTAGLRLVCNEAQVWTLRPESYTAAGAMSVRSGINLIDGEDVIDRDAGLTFDSAVAVYEWTDAANVPQRRVDSYASVTPHTLTGVFEFNTPYPGPGFAEYAVRRALSRGREVTVTAVSDWTAAAEQPCEFVLAGAPTQLGKTDRVTFNLDTDEMTATARTTDVPLGAIDLLAGTINALAGSINSL